MGDHMLQNLDKMGKGGNSRIMNSRVWCLVDRCNADLSQCRRNYHRRHKVCEPHSKKPSVVVGGVYQRFCQQCSRFHRLGEFDEEKRSCRKRLDVHNRRRRKPQIDSRATTDEETREHGTKISLSHEDSWRLHSAGSDWAKADNSIAPFDDQPVHNNVCESSSWFTVSTLVGFNHFRFFPCEPVLAADSANHDLSLLPLPMEPVPCGLDRYDSMPEVDNTYACFSDCKGLH